MSAHRTEIERRFLVHAGAWSAAAAAGTREHFVQIYLAVERERTVRVRLCGERAVLAVKGPSAEASRTEIECDIAADAARAILDAGFYAGVPVEKTRSTLRANDLVWEVDQFEGANAGLIIAEVEFTGDESERPAWEACVDRERPEWVGREITSESRFANSRLAILPFASWRDEDRAAVMREIESAAS